jgi:hypothetical protein
MKWILWASLFFSNSYAQSTISVCITDSLTSATTASCDGKLAGSLERNGGDPGAEHATTYFLYKKLNEGYKIVSTVANEKTGSIVYTLIKSGK